VGVFTRPQFEFAQIHRRTPGIAQTKPHFTLAREVLFVGPEGAMTLKHYFSISVLVFVLVIGAVRHFFIPVLPIAAILLVGETLLGFQLEDHRVPKVLKELFTVPNHGR
jgi:hypothetical protein